MLGASGGTGLAAIEIGKIMGARVIACASSEEKLAFARSHGADETVNYASEDLRDALKRLGGARGNRRGLRSGRWTICGTCRSLARLGRPLSRHRIRRRRNSKLPLNLVLLKSCDIRGVLWGAWALREPDGQRALMTDIVRWCAEGKLSAHVHAVYPLAETAQALKAITDRKVMGKIVLRP